MDINEKLQQFREAASGGSANTTYTLEVRDSDESLLDLLLYLQWCGMAGHSVSFKIDNLSFGFDGDGADNILTIKKDGKKVERKKLTEEEKKLRDGR